MNKRLLVTMAVAGLVIGWFYFPENTNTPKDIEVQPTAAHNALTQDKVSPSMVAVGEYVRVSLSRGGVVCRFNGTVNDRLVMTRNIGYSATNVYYPLNIEQVKCGEVILKIIKVTPMQLTYEIID